MNSTAKKAMTETPAAKAIDAPHVLTGEACVAALQSNATSGLSATEVETRRQRYGANQLPSAPHRPWWLSFAGQFNQLVVWILIVAAVIAGMTGDMIDTFVILAIVLLNGILGFAQEERAERALESLKKMTLPTARACRDGRPQSIAASELVPGDIVLLEAGDNVPADARLLEAFTLTVQEAALTGESLPAAKDARAQASATAIPADRLNMVYWGTTVSSGKATAVVTAIGAETELGRIAGLLSRSGNEPTPLQKRLTELGRVLVVACLAIVALIAGLLIARGMRPFDVLLPAVSLAVAAVPEGMPAVVTVALAFGLHRLVRRNALVRKLPSVETLGSVTIICTDKTGTLTRNEMTVRELLVGKARYQVTGTGYVPEGEFQPVDGSGEPAAADLADLDLALAVGAYCNNARVESKDDGRTWQVLGDPTEAALIVAAKKRGMERNESDPRREHEVPFDSTRKIMSTVFRFQDGRRVLYVKGAPETVLPFCSGRQIARGIKPLDDETMRTLLQTNSEMAGRALRVLALAYRDDPPAVDAENLQTGLTFVGLVGMIDPPREEARRAVTLCRAAGIRPVMMTGDHPGTAAAIGRELGMLDDGAAGVLAGIEVDRLSDDELMKRVLTTSVFARVTAEHKLRVVQAWKRHGEVVAMTGDGVNDAPAVKEADIGIAMGITGTDVTKDASDMVLTDDNFASIVSAVEEGRGIVDNIRKVIHYLLACNAGEMLLMLGAAVIGLPVPLTALQILWINLVTDGLPALALVIEPPEEDLMRRRPRSPQASLLSWRSGRLILLHGLFIALTSLAAFSVTVSLVPGNVEAAQLTTFCVTAFAQLFFALSCRSQRRTFVQLGLRTNGLLLVAVAVSGVLQLAATGLLAARIGAFPVLADPRLLLITTALSLLPTIFFELTKRLRSSRTPQTILLGLLVVATLPGIATAEELDEQVPTQSDVAYGSDPRQVLDFYQAKSAKPTPVLFFVHGGGWLNGDKRGFNNTAPYLAAGISVVSVEYRFVSQATAAGVQPPAKWPLHDAARALQFVRSKAKEWNLDASRIAASGSSAGACTCLWLALHDDLSDPKSDDPVARQSTRLLYAGVAKAQTSLDPAQMKAWIPNIRYGAHAFGFSDDEGKRGSAFDKFLAEREKILPWIKEYSPYELATADDPPIALYYDEAPAMGNPQDSPAHSPNFGLGLQEKLKNLGVECELVYPDAPDVKHSRMHNYLIERLKR